MELQLEELGAAEAIEEKRAIATAERPVPAKPFRRPLPEHLPREVHTHLPGQAACPGCGGRLRELGEDTAEMLEYVRACFKVIRNVRPKLSCDGCDRIVQAPAPSRPIDRGIAGPGLLAHVLVAKYADSLPLYRQSEIYSRQGVDLDRSTLAGWVGATSHLCQRYLKIPRIGRLKNPQLRPSPIILTHGGLGWCDWRVSWRYRSYISTE